MKQILLPIALMLAISSAISMPVDSLSAYPFADSVVPSGAFVFYVIGDWGRKGEYHQKGVARAMNECAAKVPPKFIISTGDNFYTFGVKSVKDKQWKESFENIYETGGMKETDWYPVLGNHDSYGCPKAEIQYSTINTHWKMPGKHYSEKFRVTDSSEALFVFTNTEELVHKHDCEQWAWIDTTLANNRVSWNFVIGHHPVYSSNHTHGDSRPLIEQLKPILEKYNVQAYLCGHDHDLQHQQPQGSKVEYFVSGAGSELRPSDYYQHTLFAKSAAGFIIVALKEKTMNIYFVDENGFVLYQYSKASN